MKAVRQFLGAIALGFLAVNCDANPAAGAADVKENRLAKASSPYLRLHATNPVNWYPWGEEAFAKAKKENKPILLSIGYSTCHWCHVMARESFANEEIAKVLNESFVSIKLDREERPDVDKVYMTAYHAMSGESGGWPLNMFLTPDLEPFFGGTYFPPEDRGGRVGFLNVLKQLEIAWAEKHDQVVVSAAAIRKHLLDQNDARIGGDEIPESLNLDRAAISLFESGDKLQGGWGAGPKFPMPSHLRFLLRSWKRTGDEELLAFAELTADRMANAGIHDHLGGGFHRYSVDGKWLVPHFEKMLYDQAQLLDFYLDLYQITHKEKYQRVARGIADYVLRDMTNEQGAFYCAEDAQSEGKEGKFFAWTTDELKKLLEPAQFEVACAYFGITQNGNFYDHSDPEALDGQNVLSILKSNKWLDEKAGRRSLLTEAVAQMKKARSTRIRPATDTKVLAFWNGMMIGALARAGKVLDDSSYVEAAVRAHDFISAEMWDGKRLSHSWHAGVSDRTPQAESYLLMLQASRRLYELTLDEETLGLSVALAEASIELFYDPERGGFYESAVADDVLVRLKGDYDGALPTASSISSMEFLKLAEITGREDFQKVAEGSFKAYAEVIKRSPTSVTAMLQALDFYHSKRQRLVLAEGENGVEAFYREIGGSYLPNLTTMGTAGLVGEFERTHKPIKGKTAAYLCEGETCQLPVTEPKVLFKLVTP